MTTRKLTCIEWIAATEPHLLTMVADPSTAFIGDTERAHRVAVEAGIRRDEGGRYEPVVWIAVFP